MIEEADGAPTSGVTTRRVPIEHIVILFQENHTYDSLFADAEGGLGDTTAPIDTDPQGIAYKTTPTHGNWWSMRYSTLNAYHSRLTREQIPLYREWGDRYALCDTYHVEKNGPSDFNHVSTAVANTDVVGKDGRLQTWIDNPQGLALLQALGRFFRNDPEVMPPITPPAVQSSLEEQGYSWGIYGDSCFANVATELPSGDALNRSARLHLSDDFAAAARAGDLPTVSWVAAEGTASGGPPGAAADGMLWSAKQLQAIVDGGLWEKTAVFMTWDDSGGFFDHLGAPNLEALAQDPNRQQRLGMRVPCVVISPYAKSGYRSSQERGLKSHRSLLKFVNEYLGLPALDPVREGQIDSMWDCFDFNQSPLPPPETALSTPLPTMSLTRRVAAEVRRIPAKFQANILWQEMATLYVLDRWLGPEHSITRAARKVLGLDEPKTGLFSRQGVPSNPLGYAVYTPLALAMLVPGMILDAVLGVMIRLGITGMPAPHAAGRARRYNRVVASNRRQGITSPPNSVDDAVWAARVPRTSAHVEHPGAGLA